MAAGLDWDAIARDSKDWANDHERALARQFVATLDQPRDPVPTNRLAPPPDSGKLYWELTAKGESGQALAGAIRSVLAKQTVLGLSATEGIPARPAGPGLAWRGVINDDGTITVLVEVTDAQGAKWTPMGEFTVKRPADANPPTGKEALTRLAAETADQVAAGVLGRVVRVQLSKPKRVQDKLIYQVQIANDSPLVLNGLAVAGPDESGKAELKALAGLNVPPHKTMSVPATTELVQRLGLKDGVRVVAADLSGL